MKLEFGNPQHIDMAREGAKHGYLLSKDPSLAQEAEREEHSCNCEHCDLPDAEYSCPECGGIFFHTIPNELWCAGHQQYEKTSRRFCRKEDCEQEVLFGSQQPCYEKTL